MTVDARVSAWRHRLLLIAPALITVLVGFSNTFFDMVRVWSTSSTFNHCFLILPIAIYLGFHKREELAVLPPAEALLGVLYALANGLLWTVGELMSIAFFQHLAVVGLLIGVTWALVGNRVFLTLLFPFAYLYFSVPEGEVLVPYLQDLTATVLVAALRLTGIPVFIEGRYLTIPSGSFVVAEACSGINYLIATMAVATMFMYLRFRSLWRRIAFMLLALAVPLIANGLRAYGIVMIAHMSDYKYAMGVDHFIYGWVFFGIVIFALFSIGNLFSDEDDAPEPPAPIPVGPPRPAKALLVGVLAVAAAFAPRGIVSALDSGRPAAPEARFAAVPGWAGPEAVQPSLGLDFPGADRILAAVYESADGTRVHVEAAHFRVQQEGRELINQTNVLFDELRWKQLGHGVRALPDGSAVRDVVELRLRSPDTGDDYLVWHWYETPYSRSANRLRTKLGEARARLGGAPAAGAFVMIRTPEVADVDVAARLAALAGAGALLEPASTEE